MRPQPTWKKQKNNAVIRRERVAHHERTKTRLDWNARFSLCLVRRGRADSGTEPGASSSREKHATARGRATRSAIQTQRGGRTGERDRHGTRRVREVHGRAQARRLSSVRKW